MLLGPLVAALLLRGTRSSAQDPEALGGRGLVELVHEELDE